MTKSRPALVMGLITVAVFALLLGRAAQLQLVRGDRYEAESARRAATASPTGADAELAGDTP